MFRLLFVLLMLGFAPLGGCSTENQLETEPRIPESPPDKEVEVENRVDLGLIIDPGFEIRDELGENVLKHWQLSQHAGEPSYEVHMGGGSVRIARVASQPWGALRQNINVSEHAGRTLEFSVELSADLDDSWGPPMEETALLVSVLGFGPNDLHVMGQRVLLNLLSKPSLGPGRHEWRRHRLRFEVPDGVDLELSLGMQLTLGGELRARNPALVVVED